MRVTLWQEVVCLLIGAFLQSVRNIVHGHSSAIICFTVKAMCAGKPQRREIKRERWTLISQWDFFCTCTLRELLCNICLKNNAFIFAYIFPTKIYLTVTLSINYKYCLDQKQSPRDIQFTFKCPVAKVSILFTSGHVFHPFLSKNFSCNLLKRRFLPFLFEINAFCVTPNTLKTSPELVGTRPRTPPLPFVGYWS